MEQTYQRLNNLTGWIVFLAALLVYTLTLEPTVSLWDCGEFISAAYKLQVMHPPGAPFFELMGRLYTMTFGNLLPVESPVAVGMNLMSASASAGAVLFIFWSITALSRKIIFPGGNITKEKILIVLGAGIVGAAAGAFADSFWFSAVEGEVYALSSFFTAFVFWASLKWERNAHKPYSDRWLLFIALAIGLAIGVHLLSILTIPAIVFVYYFKKFEVTQRGLLYTFLIACVILGFIQFGIITGGIPKLLASFELNFVNPHPLSGAQWVFYFILLLGGIGLMALPSYNPKLNRDFTKKTISLSAGVLLAIFAFVQIMSAFHLPFYSGVFAFLLVMTGLLVASIYYTHQHSLPYVNMALLCLSMIIIGYGAYATLIIRSNANPSIDMNDPEDPFSFKSFITREQYGETPLLYGHYFTADVVNQEQGAKNYYKADDKYKVKGRDIKQEFDPAEKTIFPRMWNNRRPKYERFYRNWEDLEKGETPSFYNNLHFFITYQLGWMYWRYFMWNFSGRQNDKQGHGGVKKGNWLTGIDFIDELRLPLQEDLPPLMKNNEGYNKFYMLPFLLGLIGLFFQFKRTPKWATVVALLFFFTGIAIVIYLNQKPLQPRERDYSYAGSFLAYSIWIGIGTLAIYELLKEYLKQSSVINALLAILICAVPPALMGAQGWEDHDRSRRYATRDFANNYLQSCPENAILFTQGDNDTYPLWYAQEVEGIRTDIRIANLSLLSVDWYIDQLKEKVNDAPGIPFSMKSSKYRGSNRDYIRHFQRQADKNRYYNAHKIVRFIASDKSQTKLRVRGGRQINYLPTRKLKLPVNKEKVKESGIVPPEKEDEIVSSIKWKIGKKNLIKSNLMILDLISQIGHKQLWNRPLCFAVSVSPNTFLGLDKYFQLEGLVYKFVPVKSKLRGGRVSNINTDRMYKNVMEKFRWGNVDADGIHMGENLRRMAMNLRIQMNQLSRALIKEGKTDSALHILDSVTTHLPHKSVPYNAVMAQTAELYYRAGDPKEARDIIQKLFNLLSANVNYYIRVQNKDKEHFGAFKGQLKRQLYQILPQLIRITGKYKDTTINNELKQRYRQLQQRAKVRPPQQIQRQQQRLKKLRQQRQKKQPTKTKKRQQPSQ